jgi:sugar phosphate isomerase/epimerase
MSAFRLVGYDYVISIEHEDGLMSTDEGLRKAVAILKDVAMFESPGEMYWA